MSTKTGLKTTDQREIEMVVGIPVAWTSEALGGEAQKALAVRREAGELGLKEQVQLQENYLRCLAFLNLMAGEGIMVQPLTITPEVQTLGSELIPPMGIRILAIAHSMKYPIEIEEWAILKPARKVLDPYLAFRVAGKWYSVFQWE